MMPSSKTIFLTGASGFIGRYLLRDLLLQGNRVVALSRRRGLYSAKDRIEAIVQDWENKLQRRLLRPIVVEGDVREPFCGFANLFAKKGAKSASASLPSAFRNIDALLHSAASLRFEVDQSGEEPMRTNIDGVQNAIGFAQKLGIPEFHHISTAYVCGKRGAKAVSADELDVGQDFKNIYEQTKLQAEQLIHHATGFKSKTIYRPSIVVGDSVTGFTSTFTTIYSLLRFMRALPEHNAINLDWILSRLQLSGHEGKNLVPVDWVSQRILDVVHRPEYHGQTIHLTNPIKACGDHIRDAIKEAIAIAHDQWQAMASRSNVSSDSINISDEAFSVHLEAYRGYLEDDPNFVPTHMAGESFWKTPPRIDKQLLVKLFVYAINSRFRDTTPFPVPTQDGTLSGMEHAMPIDLWIEQYLSIQETKKNKKDSGKLQGVSFDLRLAGLGGGVWAISKNPLDVRPSGAFVHLSVDSWCDLLQKNISVAELLTQRKIVLGIEGVQSSDILELLDELVEDSWERWKAQVAGEVPSVLPINQHRKGGRRLA